MNARTSFPPRSVHEWLANDREDLAIRRMQVNRPEGTEQSSQPDEQAQLSPQVEAASRWLDRVTIVLIGVIALLLVLLIHAQTRN